jgi:RecA/RadA recombinase
MARSPGKTTLTLQVIAAEMQSWRGQCAFVDAEHAAGHSVRKTGVNLQDLLISFDTGERAGNRGQSGPVPRWSI